MLVLLISLISIRVLTKQEIKDAINTILNVSKKDQLLAILEALPSETGDNINPSEILKVRLIIIRGVIVDNVYCLVFPLQFTLCIPVSQL